MIIDTPFSSTATTILVAAGKPSFRHGVQYVLQKEGFEVWLAADRDEALAALRKAPYTPHLIISDVDLPPCDGLEFLRTIRENGAWLGIPFLFLAEQDELEFARQGYLLGADDCLTKPLDREQFLLIIRGKLKRSAELQEHLAAQRSTLEAAKSAFTLMVAHELRTPLVSISMAADILSRQISGLGLTEFQDMIDIMLSGSVRISRVVEQVILYIALDSGALHETLAAGVRASPVRDAVIGAIDRARQFSYVHRENPVQFDELDPDALVQCDLAALKHALAEVICNAMAFSRPDKPVQITQWVSDGRVWVTITDYGPGIPADELPYVFQPYRQLNRQTYEQQGIGLGLPLARGIIEVHGGAFEFCSVLDRGTQVIISLPLCKENGAAMPEFGR